MSNKKVDSVSVIKKAQELLKKYVERMNPIHERMIDNEEWYKSRQWDRIRNEKFKNDPEPTTAFVLSTIQNKHADAMDHYPKPNIMPRDPDDVEEAKRLSEIIPVELEYNDFKDTWSKVWYDKLKLGSGIYAVLFDAEGNGGIGSTSITSVDPLNFYCDPFVPTLNKSRGVFTAELIDKDTFKELYPDINTEKAGKLFEPKHYNTISHRDTSSMVLVIDYYYLKRMESGQTVCHLLKFVNDIKLYWSEEDSNYNDGYYKIDQYPFEIDTMYPEKDNLFGFGLIDVVKSPQIYIDKLDQIILTNTFAHTRKRFFATKDLGINEKDFLDPSKTLITVESGFFDETKLREFKVEPTHAGVYNHRLSKIEELKDTSTANEFSRGETNGGVIAAQAIVALQKASGKTSRAAISQSYSVFSRTIYLDIEIKRQFYDIPRNYRVDDNKEESGYRFVEFDNSNLQDSEIAEGKYRHPVFDIRVEAEKQEPFSQMAQNELAKELYSLGFFNPDMAIQAEAALEIMNFDGRDRVLEIIKMNSQREKMQQMMMSENQKLKMIVQGATGEDLGVPMGGANDGGYIPEPQGADLPPDSRGAFGG